MSATSPIDLITPATSPIDLITPPSSPVANGKRKLPPQPPTESVKILEGPPGSAGPSAAPSKFEYVDVVGTGGAPELEVKWEQTLAPGHTEPQPLPGQTLIYKSRDADGTQRSPKKATTREWRPFAPRVLGKPVVEVYDVGGSKVTLLRNYDGAEGQVLAASLEGTFGADVLGGRGSENKCSIALNEPNLFNPFAGIGDSCQHFKDGFIKLLPLMGSHHGGNFDGDVQRDVVMRGFFDAAWHTAGYKPAHGALRGSLQVLRFRADGYGHKGAPSEGFGPKKVQKKNVTGGDRLHTHVDQDKAVGRVGLLSVGNTVRFSLDEGPRCARLKRCKAVDGKPKSQTEESPTAWHETACSSCEIVEMRSGDVLLFDGRPEAAIAHAVLETLSNTGPAGLPAWAHDCRVSVQYRLKEHCLM